jgi:hypothetical protein
LRDLPKQKIPREIRGGGEPAIFLHSHVPMERCFDGTDQENSKTLGERGQIMKVQKIKKERMEERKRRDFYCMWRFPYSSCVLHRSGTPSGYHHCATLPQENPLVWEPPLQKTTTQIGAWNKVICQVSVFFPCAGLQLETLLKAICDIIAFPHSYSQVTQHICR